MKKKNLPRRNFLKSTSTALTMTTLASTPLLACATTNQITQNQRVTKDWTIQEVIDLMIAKIPGGKKAETVDTVKSPPS